MSLYRETLGVVLFVLYYLPVGFLSPRVLSPSGSRRSATVSINVVNTELLISPTVVSLFLCLSGRPNVLVELVSGVSNLYLPGNPCSSQTHQGVVPNSSYSMFITEDVDDRGLSLKSTSTLRNHLHTRSSQT